MALPPASRRGEAGHVRYGRAQPGALCLKQLALDKIPCYLGFNQAFLEVGLDRLGLFLMGGAMHIFHAVIISCAVLIFSCPRVISAAEQTSQTTVKKDDVTTEIACSAKDSGSNEAKDPCLPCSEKSWGGVFKGEPAVGNVVDVAALSTGKGAQFRHWQPEDIVLVAEGERIKPCDEDPFYVPKESVAKDAATAVFVGLGSADSSGECHEGGGKGKTARAIDRAGMAAGLGLLTSQSRGDITGLRARFKIPPGRSLKDARVEAKLANSDTHQKMSIDAPARFAALESTPSEALPSQTFNIAR